MTSLVLGWVYPSEVNGLFMQSVLNLMVADDQRGENSRLMRNGATIGVASGPRIAAARNEVVENFLLRTKGEWLLMVDSDMVFSPQDVETLFSVADRKDRPIVGGLCFGGARSGVMFPTIYRLVPGEQNRSPVEVIEDYPRNALCQVDATGAAFLLMHRSALERIGEKFGKPHPWFAEGTVYRGMTFGEDWAFCMRAREMNIPVYVHTGAKIGHVKPQVLTEEVFDAYKSRKDEIGEGGIVQAFRQNLNGRRDFFAVPTFAIVPQKGKTDLTESLLKQLDGIPTLVLDDGTDPDELAGMDTAHAELLEVGRDTTNIHRLWNEGIRWARKQAPVFNLAILNNDLRLGPHCLTRLATALRADDKLLAVCPNYDRRPGSGVNYITGTYGARGLSGFCFMVKGEAFGKELPLFDENFSWWYGDDDFVMNVEAAGHKCGLVYGASVIHLGDGHATGHLGELVKADRERFVTKWKGKIRLSETQGGSDGQETHDQAVEKGNIHRGSQESRQVRAS